MGKNSKIRKDRKLEEQRVQMLEWRKKQFEKWAPYTRLIWIWIAIISTALITILSVHLTVGYSRNKVISGPWGKITKEELKQNRFATIETNYGTFKIELYYKNAPKTVANFILLVQKGFYNKLSFHRIIENFMIQGGDPKGDGTGGPGYSFEDEINPKIAGVKDEDIKQNEAQGYKYDYNLTTIKLEQGVVAMANTGANTNGSQFFIIVAKSTPWLDGKHTPFGKIIQGYDIVEKISKVKTDKQGKSVKKVIIKSIILSSN